VWIGTEYVACWLGWLRDGRGWIHFSFWKLGWPAGCTQQRRAAAGLGKKSSRSTVHGAPFPAVQKGSEDDDNDDDDDRRKETGHGCLSPCLGFFFFFLRLGPELSFGRGKKEREMSAASRGGNAVSALLLRSKEFPPDII
jgi:hypothetical protein